MIINPSNGIPVWGKTFDTYKSSFDLDTLLMNNLVDVVIPDGFIVVAACKDECVTNLSKKAKSWFESLGSTLISKLKP